MEADRRVTFGIRTAENASGRCAYGDAIRVLQHAQSLVPRLAAKARGEVEVELLQRIGDAHFGRGAMSECAQAYEAAAARAADAGLTSARVAALSNLARPLCFIDPDRARMRPVGGWKIFARRGCQRLSPLPCMLARQKTPSAQVTNASDSEQRLVLPVQLWEQGKHDNAPWHWPTAVQAPHSPTMLVLH
jgi:hypothetical protein